MSVSVIKQNVGNDISKDDFKVSFRQAILNDKKELTSKIKASRTFKNTIKGFESFVKWVESKRDKSVQVCVAVEATGVYHEQLVNYLHDLTDYRLSVILPNKSKSFAKSLNLKTKTDKADAEMLGKMGLERDLDQWKPISYGIRNLKSLCRERMTLIDHKTALLNRIHALNHSHEPCESTLTRLKMQVEYTKSLIKLVEKEIKELVKQDDILCQKVEKVCSIPGVGLTTAATLVAETDGFALFTSHKQLVSFAGYDVVERQSGSSIKGKTRISKRGNRFIRRCLHFPAMTSVKYVKELKELNDRVFDRTRIKMKGYVAVQRKLLVLAYTLFNKNESFDPNFQKKIQEQKAKENGEKLASQMTQDRVENPVCSE